MARGGAGPRRVHSGTTGRARPGCHRAQHQPADRPHPEPPGTDVSAKRLGPRADDRGRRLPVRQPAGRHGRLATRGRRPDPRRRRRHRPVRLPERAVRLPPPRSRRRPRRAPPGQDHRRTGTDPRPGGRGARQGRQWLGAPRVRDRVERRGHPVPGDPPQAQGPAHRFTGPASGRHGTASPRA